MPRTRKKPEQTTGKAVMRLTRTLYGRDQEQDVIEGEIEKFETDPAFVTVGASVTKNTGNYESLKLEVRLSTPCYKEDVDEQFERVAAAVSDKLDAELDKYVEGGDTGEEEELDEEDEDTGDEDEDEDEVEDDDEEEESDTDDEEDDDEDDEEDLEEDEEEDEEDDEDEEDEEEAPPPKRGRGRPRKNPPANPRSTRRTAARASRGRRR